MDPLSLNDDLIDLKALRTNRIWKNHILPELTRLREAHRHAMRDRTLSQAERCEHITAWEDMETLLEFLAKTEKQIRETLRAHENASPIIERPFSSAPP